MNNQLSYPIKLHYKNPLMATIFYCLLIVVSVFFIVFARHNWIVLILLLILLMIGVIALLTVIINKPSIILNYSGIELHYFTQQNQQLLWSEIEHIELDKIYSRNTSDWKLIIITKQGFGENIIYPIYPLMYKDLSLNEKEVFAIIEQSFYGKQPIYQEIDMSFLTRLKEKFATPTERIETFKAIGIVCFIMLVTGVVSYGKIASASIKKEIITLENGLTYNVGIAGGFAGVSTEIGFLVYSAPCQDVEERENYLCRKSFDEQKFIGNNVKFFKYYQNNNISKGIFLSGTFTNKADNTVHTLITTEEDISKMKSSFRLKIWSARIWLLANLFGLIISIIGIKREKSIED